VIVLTIMTPYNTYDLSFCHILTNSQRVGICICSAHYCPTTFDI